MDKPAIICYNATVMAITKSAKKAIPQNKKRKARNIVYKNKMKNLLKEVRFLISKKETNEAKKLLPSVYEILDKSAKVGVIKKTPLQEKSLE